MNSTATPRDLLAPLAIGAAVLVVALLGATPGLAPLDAGDFVTAAVDVGVPHATGFPAHTLLDVGAVRVPLANVAARAAWPSALAMALAAAAATWLIGRTARGPGPALLGGLAVVAACSSVDTLAMHARVPEVYALNVALALLAVALLVALDERRDLRLAGVLGVVVGLGVANHALFRVWAPALIVGVAVASGPGRRARGAGLAVAFAVLASGAWAYLPAAALRRPRHNWGDPSTLEALWRHANASEIREAFGDQMLSGWAQVSLALGALIDQLVQGLGAAVLLGVIGLLVAGFRRPKLALMLAALAFADVAYAVALNPMGLRDAQNGQLVALVLALGYGALIAAAGEVVSMWSRGRRPALAMLSAAAVVGVAWTPAGERMTPQVDHTAEDLALIHLGTAAPGSVTAVVSDLLVASHVYAHVALDVRPDAAVFGRGWLSTARGLAQLEEHAPFELVGAVEAPADGNVFGVHVVALLQRHLGHRVVYWEIVGMDRDLPGGVGAREGWPLYELTLAPPAPRPCTARDVCPGDVDAAFGRAARAVAGATGAAYRGWLGSWWGARGVAAFGRGAYADAAAAFDVALTLRPSSAAYRASLAAALASLGRIEEAYELAAEGATIDPSHAASVRNALRYAQAMGRDADVAQWAAQAERYGIDVRDLVATNPP